MNISKTLITYRRQTGHIPGRRAKNAGYRTGHTYPHGSQQCLAVWIPSLGLHVLFESDMRVLPMCWMLMSSSYAMLC